MRTIPALLLCSLAWSGCASTAYLAKVNGQPITGTDLGREFTRRHGGHQRFLAGEAEVRRFLDVVIDWKLLVQEAYRLDLEDEPEVRKATAAYLDRQAVNALVAAEIAEKAKPTPEQVREFWERKTTELFLVDQIVVDTREQAEAVRDRVLAGESFDALARELSTAPSRLFGGRLPVLGWGTIEPAWEEAVFTLAPRELAPVLETRDGWEVVRLEAKRQVERPEFEKARERIQGILEKRMTEQRKREFSGFLWSKYHAGLTDADRSLPALGAAAREHPETVLATWDGGSLAAREALAQLDVQELASLPSGRLARAVDERVRAMVNEPLALLEARARGMDRLPEVVEAARRYREDLMEGALYDEYVLKGVSVTDDEVRAYYDAHAAELVSPERRRVAHIVAGTLEEAQDVRRRIEAGEAFDELARTRSTDVQSAKAGGDLGWIGRKDVPPDFAPVLSLQDGEVSGPIPSKFGYHLIKVLGIEPARPLPFETAKEDVRKTLLERKQREVRAAWVAKLRAASKIVVNAAGVRAFHPAPAQPEGAGHSLE